MVTEDPTIRRWVGRLQATCREQVAHPGQQQQLTLSLAEVEEVRDCFARLIRRGEAKLHRLCAALCQSYLENWEIHSVVIGEVPGSAERFTLVQSLRPEAVFELTDVDLGNRQLQKLRFVDEQQRWSQPGLVANFLDYEPLELGALGIHRICSRIKAEEEVWNKVVDEMFEIDQLVQRDKQLAHLSRYVKDIFGLKVVVGADDKVHHFHQQLQCWSPAAVTRNKFALPADVDGLEFLETKDYMVAEEGKQSGWRALKSVVRWWGETFEVQVQPLRNYLRERERLSRESHASFKGRRDELRSELSRLIPLYGFYRDLLRWIFLRPGEGPPQLPDLQLVLVD